MGDYIERMAALNVNFKIPTRFCESKLTTARKAVQEYANEIAKIPAADVRPVVLCLDCKHNNACLTQAFVEEASRVPFDRNTWFCYDGERIENADN